MVRDRGSSWLRDVTNGKIVLGSKGTVDSDPPPVSVAAGNLVNYTVMWPLKGSRLISVALVADGVLLSADSLFQPLNRR